MKLFRKAKNEKIEAYNQEIQNLENQKINKLQVLKKRKINKRLSELQRLKAIEEKDYKISDFITLKNGIIVALLLVIFGIGILLEHNYKEPYNQPLAAMRNDLISNPIEENKMTESEVEFSSPEKEKMNESVEHIDTQDETKKDDKIKEEKEKVLKTNTKEKK